MKHAGIAKTLIGCILLVVMGNVGCQQREAPVSGTTPQNPEATRPAKLADTATTAKKEPNALQRVTNEPEAIGGGRSIGRRTAERDSS
jgi:hypothetical protein